MPAFVSSGEGNEKQVFWLVGLPGHIVALTQRALGDTGPGVTGAEVALIELSAQSCGW